MTARAYYSTYLRNQTDDPSKLVYQVSISDMTRTCKYAGRNADHGGGGGRTHRAGARGQGGNRDGADPRRGAVVRTACSIPSCSSIRSTSPTRMEATQFIFSEPNVSFPGSRRPRTSPCYVGYDEGQRPPSH